MIIYIYIGPSQASSRINVALCRKSNKFEFFKYTKQGERKKAPEKTPDILFLKLVPHGWWSVDYIGSQILIWVYLSL